MTSQAENSPYDRLVAEFRDSWRGYSVRGPEGWRPAFPPIEGVAFVPTDGPGFLELARVDSADADSAVRQRLAQLRPPQTQSLSSGPEQAAIAFADDRSRGEVHARVTGGQALVALAHLPEASPLQPHALIADLVGSLSAVEPIGRSRWVEPTEQAFNLPLPTGWQVQSALRPTGSGRDLLARVSRDERTFAAVEPSMTTYVNGPPQLPFDQPLPLQPGLQPLVHQVIYPQLAQAYGGGVELIGHDVWNDPLKAEVRFALPDGTIRVIMLNAFSTPGLPHWIGGIAAYYQAPADDLAGLEAVLRGIIADAKTNQQWQAADTAMRQQVHAQNMATQQGWANLSTNLHNQRMNDIAMAGQANTAIHNQRMATADQQIASYQQRAESSDQQQHDTINSIRGTSDYLDAGSGQVYNIEDGYERVWSDQRGNLVAADWNLDPPADWTELRRLPPGTWHD